MEKIAHFGFVVFLLPLIFIFSCQPNTKLDPGEGYAQVTGGKVWYRIVGDSDKTPVLLLHGGPGFTSYYLNPMKDLGKVRPIIFFDQLGCGRSDRNIDTSLMTTENFVKQVEELRTYLGIKEFYLYGHSWGTMLGVDYYLKYPDHVKAMILASPALSLSKWMEDAEGLIKTLPDSIQTMIKINDESGTYNSPEYQQAMQVFYQNYVIRKLPWDANIDSTFAGANLEVYEHMWGPSEFKATGNLKHFERIDKLNEIKVPTLFVCGEYDEARPATVKYFQSLVPNAKFSMIKNAAHITMHDNPVDNNEVIGNFLMEIEE